MIKKVAIYLITGAGLFLLLTSVLITGWFLYKNNHVDALSDGLKADLEKVALVFLKHKKWTRARVMDGCIHFYDNDSISAMDIAGVRSLEKIKLSEFAGGKEIGRRVLCLVKSGKNVLFVTGGILNNTYGWVYSKDGCIEFRGNGEIYNASAIAGESAWFEFDTICK